MPNPKPHAYKANASQPQLTVRSGVYSALQYEAPVYKDNGAGSYIEFRAYDPNTGKMHRKTIKLNHVKGSAKRKAYAREVINRLNDQLSHGWNPWVAQDASNLVLFDDAVSRYEQHIEKMLVSGYFRKETYDGYKSYVKIMRQYITEKKHIYYCYQFDRRFCIDFLDYVFLDRDNGAQTRNNYLGFLRVFSSFLVEKGLLNTKPTDGIEPISKRLYTKERECIPTDVISKIANHCQKEDPHFLLACYLLYYCFVRPVEMTRLKVSDFCLQSSTLTISAENSKNKKTQTVTVPKKVLLYAIDIGIFSAPMGDYIFSDKLSPGKEPIDTKIFRDHWEKVRKALKLRKEWKFYSLKDTGITEMCDAKMASIAVRDQARHSSLSITDIYTRHSNDANKDIIDFDGAL